MIKSNKFRSHLANTIIYAFLITLSIIWILPLLWLVIRSFQGTDVAWINTVLPDSYSFHNYTRLFTDTTQFNFPKWYMNTLIVAIFTCALTTMMVLMISYTFSRIRFKSRMKFMNAGLIMTMFPGFMTMIAVYHILKAIGLYQSHISLVLVYSTTGALSYF
ncbi:MAG: sugar ABC transporter permease, partial [Pseudoflavonifractor sp.]